MHNHKKIKIAIPRSQDQSQNSMQRNKRVVSPDSIFFLPHDVHNIENREEQASAVDAVVKSSSHIETPQDAKRFKMYHEYPSKLMNGKPTHCLQHGENMNQFYTHFSNHSNFHPYCSYYANHRYVAANSLPSYSYPMSYNSPFYNHMEHKVPYMTAVLPEIEGKNQIRRDTSLGALCLKFLDEYEKMQEGNINGSFENLASSAEAPEISIDITSASLQVGRRRIYDIVNILESIGIVSRKCKNTYNWHGRDGIKDTFRKLQIEAITTYPEDAVRCGLVESVEDAKSIATNHMKTEQKVEIEKPPINGLELLLASAEHMEDILPKAEKNESDQLKQSRRKNTKENSLGMISQKFIQMFLLGNETVELSATCEKIFGKDENLSEGDYKKMIKTKIRRMYDIANVMTSLGFVRKATDKTQKSAFHWCYNKSAKDLWGEQKF